MPLAATGPADEASADLIEAIKLEVDARADDLMSWRERVHAHPEVSFQERHTTALIDRELTAAGIEHRLLPGSGVIADLGHPEPHRRIGLRGDMDALPIQEVTGLPYTSTVEGVAHACGHDVHTIGLLGAALALKQLESALIEDGIAVRLLFQPAEEAMPGGAHLMIEHGALEGVDQLLALHCDPSIDVGTVGLRTGPITAASDSVHVILTGRGGHTSRPHLTQDLTQALGAVLTQVPAVLSRRLDPRAAATLVWGMVSAGSAPNVIPTRGECTGTVRLLDSDAWDLIGPLVDEIVEQVVAPYGVTATVHHTKGVPPVDNEPSAVQALAEAVTSLLGPSALVSTVQSMGGEDLGWYLTSVPGAMARLGTRTPAGPTYELHQGDLVVDEGAVLIAAKLLAAAVFAAAEG